MKKEDKKETISSEKVKRMKKGKTQEAIVEEKTIRKEKTKQKREKKEVDEAQVEVKAVTQTEEKETNTTSKHPRAYFLPRVLAYVIDYMIITAALFLISSIIPQDKNYESYLKEYEDIQTKYMESVSNPDKKENTMTAEEYVNRSADVTYDLDRCNVPIMIIEAFVVLGYYSVFAYYNHGQTIGKKLMKIRIVSTNGKEVSMNQYIYRSLLIHSLLAKIILIEFVLFIGRANYFYASFVVQGIQMVLIIVSIFMVLYSKNGRGLHDRLARTQVVMTD